MDETHRPSESKYRILIEDDARLCRFTAKYTGDEAINNPENLAMEDYGSEKDGVVLVYGIGFTALGFIGLGVYVGIKSNEYVGLILSIVACFLGLGLIHARAAKTKNNARERLIKAAHREINRRIADLGRRSGSVDIVVSPSFFQVSPERSGQSERTPLLSGDSGATPSYGTAT